MFGIMPARIDFFIDVLSVQDSKCSNIYTSKSVGKPKLVLMFICLKLRVSLASCLIVCSYEVHGQKLQ